jgi:hypothetical protein
LNNIGLLFHCPVNCLVLPVKSVSLIDAAKEFGEEFDMVNQLIDREAWNVPVKYKGNPDYKTPIDYAKSDEMRDLLKPYIK